MSDLISRSALIKHLTDWRLQECPVGICDEETETYKTICECIEAVEEQPTAHDVEKVVAELKKQKSDLTDWAEDKAFEIGIERAIEVVRKGGVE